MQPPYWSFSEGSDMVKSLIKKVRFDSIFLGNLLGFFSHAPFLPGEFTVIKNQCNGCTVC